MEKEVGGWEINHEIKQRLECEPDVAFSDIKTRVSYSWVLGRRIKEDDPRASIYFRTNYGQIKAYEMAVGRNAGDAISSLKLESVKKINGVERRCINMADVERSRLDQINTDIERTRAEYLGMEGLIDNALEAHRIRVHESEEQAGREIGQAIRTWVDQIAEEFPQHRGYAPVNVHSGEGLQTIVTYNMSNKRVSFGGRDIDSASSFLNRSLWFREGRAIVHSISNRLMGIRTNTNTPLQKSGGK